MALVQSWMTCSAVELQTRSCPVDIQHWDDIYRCGIHIKDVEVFIEATFGVEQLNALGIDLEGSLIIGRPKLNLEVLCNLPSRLISSSLGTADSSVR